MEAETIVVTRAYNYDETLVLGKSAEEQLLREALADDLARQVCDGSNRPQPAARCRSAEVRSGVGSADVLRERICQLRRSRTGRRYSIALRWLNRAAAHW